MLDESDDLVFAKPVLAAHLGDLTGAQGEAALRRAIRLSGPGSRDVRCAALLALAKRVGAPATPDLVDGLATSDAAVKDYAVIGLAGAGDDRAFEQVLQHLRNVLRRRGSGRSPGVTAYALAYLARHASEGARRSELVAFVRKHWDAIDHADWFAELWPEAAPGGPAPDAVRAPQQEAIRAWVHDGLFRPLPPPLA